MKKISLIFTLFLCFISCNQYSSKTKTALAAAGENSSALEKVLDFYSKNPADSLKYKAAVFLIENMPYHSFYKPLPGFEPFFDSIAKLPYKKPVFAAKIRKDFILKTITIQQKKGVNLQPESTQDCKYFNSGFLIDNIELSFDAWNKIPKNKKASYEDFCNYILPYKTGENYIEKGFRKRLATKYAWVLQKLANGKKLSTVVDSVKSSLKFHIEPACRELYPQPMSLFQTEKIRLVICEDGANYLVAVFRALGIVSAIDQINTWGNTTNGHAWLYVKYGKEEYSTDIITVKDNLQKKYKKESIPKVMRQMYYSQNKNTLGPNLSDVTAHYVKTSSIQVPNVFNSKEKQPILCVFDKENGWKPACFGIVQGANFCFSNIGRNVLYIAASLNDEVEPINYPFYIDSNNKVRFFIPNTILQKDAILTRKYPLSTPRYRIKLDWIKNLNGSVIQGSNTADFKNAKILHKVANLKSTQPQKIALKIPEKYKFVRFYANGKGVFISKLAFMNGSGTVLKGAVFMDKMNENSEKDIFSNQDASKWAGGSAGFQVGLEFRKPTEIASVLFQVRNDNNHINVGETYELLYWDKQWKSLGEQVAKDTLLRYKTPKNALLWLKNLTTGKEEHVFNIDKNNKQYWPGSDNY
jgi:hypothetical protein